jgi:hypothetical protein
LLDIVVVVVEPVVSILLVCVAVAVIMIYGEIVGSAIKLAIACQNNIL